MNSTDIYILNPAYFLRNDVRRAIIGTYEFPEIPQDLYEKNALRIIHPYHAQMLACFNGKNNFEQSVKEISQHFTLDPNIVSSFIKNYIANPTDLHIKYGDVVFSFPKNVLIKKENYSSKEQYTKEEFEIDEDFDAKTVRLYKPVKLIIETNLNCYTNCVYCYADRNNSKAYQLMPFEKMKSLISEAKSLKIPSIELNGGEVLLYPYIQELLEHLDSNGFHPFISTKIPISKELLDLLKERNFKNIQISIDSLDKKELCRRINVTEDYLSRIIETMTRLDSMSFNWCVNVVLTKDNVDIDTHLKPLLSHLMKYQHIQSIKITPMGYPMYQNTHTFNSLRPTMKDLMRVSEYVKSLHSGNISIIFDLPVCTTDYRKHNMEDFSQRSRCSANQRGMVILPNGDVTICEELYWNPHFLIGNIIQSSIMDVWNSEKAKSLFYVSQSQIREESNCKSCDFFSKCRYDKGICWKMAIMAYGFDNWDYPDPSCPNSNEFKQDFSY